MTLFIYNNEHGLLRAVACLTLLTAWTAAFGQMPITNDENTLTLTDDSGVTIHEKQCYISNVERMAYSATLRIGWKWVSVYAAYQFNQVFSTGHEGPTFHPLTVGVSFSPF